MSDKKLKLLFQSMDGWGHISACIGLAQAFAQRGHQIVFLTNAAFSGSFEKYGFREICLKLKKTDEVMTQKEHQDGKKVHPMKVVTADERDKFFKSDFLSGKSALEKLDSFALGAKDSFWQLVYDDSLEIHSQIQQVLLDEKPDMIFLDYFMVPPCIIHGRIPWIMINSANPLFFLQSADLPPVCSGLPSNDRSQWPEFKEKLEQTMKHSIRHYQNELLKQMGHEPIMKDGGDDFILKSPYANIYGYPKELDYTDMAPLPERFFRVDAFCRDAPDKFVIPEEFQAKIRPGDKLIYLSMGSFGSMNYQLMKMIVQNLSESPHKFIVSKGAMHEMYDLPDNMWGQAFLPQTKILPLVDAVITHGGNNTVTETLMAGKPMLVMPMFGDQFDNAQRVQEKQYGYRLDSHHHTKQEILDTIDKILNDREMIERSRKLAERIRRDDSKRKVCEQIERMYWDKWNQKP